MALMVNTAGRTETRGGDSLQEEGVFTVRVTAALEPGVRVDLQGTRLLSRM